MKFMYFQKKYPYHIFIEKIQKSFETVCLAAITLVTVFTWFLWRQHIVI